MDGPERYHFPIKCLKRQQTEAGRKPLVIVACGSFSPPTLLHLRMFVMAADYIRLNTDFELMGAYMSPVGDAYQKDGLVSAAHRVRMCQLAVKTSLWMAVDAWEAAQPEYVPTAKVLDHFNYEINDILGGVKNIKGGMVPVKVSLLAGTDLIQTMSKPGLWTNLPYLFDTFGVFVVGRAGTDSEEALASQAVVGRKYIWFVPQVLNDENSSTKIRFLLKNHMSVDYLTPTVVIQYIESNRLFDCAGTHSLRRDLFNGNKSLG